MVGVFFDDLLCSPLGKKLFFIFFQFNVDNRTMLVFGDWLHFILACSICTKHIGLIFTCFLSDHIDLISDHKDRVETYTELSDQMAVFFGISGKIFYKRFCS